MTGFWSPYDAIGCADEQKRWPQLLRDVASVDEKLADNVAWKSFPVDWLGSIATAKNWTTMPRHKAKNSTSMPMF